MLERELHGAAALFLEYALPSDAFWFHPPNGEERSAATGAKLKRMGVKAGVPDIIIIHTGRCLAIELKAPKKSTSPEQKALHVKLRAAGCPVIVARSLAEIEMFLATNGVPLRARLAA